MYCILINKQRLKTIYLQLTKYIITAWILVTFRHSDHFTMEAIAMTAFGLQADEEFMTMAKNTQKFNMFSPIFLAVCK